MAKGKVLCADDDLTVRNSVKMVLEERDYEVLTAADGLEALRLFKEHKSKLCGLVLDLAMPGLTGERVLKEIRKSSKVPVIILSAYLAEFFKQKPEDRETCYVSKPFNYKEFLSYIDRSFGEYARSIKN